MAGTAANLGGVRLEQWCGGYPAQGLEMLGRVAVPLMMLALGMSLAGAPRPLRNSEPDEPVRGVSRRSGLWAAVAWKLAVMPALAVAVGMAAGLGGSQLLVPVVTAALPTAQNVFMYASRYGVAKDLARDAVLLTTAGFVPVVLLAAAILR